jgi:hypothetical protein
MRQGRRKCESSREGRARMAISMIDLAAST